jgi:hypothetical protein
MGRTDMSEVEELRNVKRENLWSLKVLKGMKKIDF